MDIRTIYLDSWYLLWTIVYLAYVATSFGTLCVNVILIKCKCIVLGTLRN